MDQGPPVTPLALARLIEGTNARALAGYAPVMRRLFPEMEPATLHVGGGVASYVGVDAPISYAVGLGMDGPVTDNDIAQVVEFYRMRGMAPRVDVCPLADSSLLPLLREQNFQLHAFVNVLARPVTADESFAPPPAGMIVREARPEEAETWVAVADEGFSDGNPITDTRRRFGMLMFSGATTTPYLVELDGEIAAAGSLFMDGLYIALTAASVRAPFRRRGIQNALIRARLTKGRELGGSIAGLFVADIGGQSQRNAGRNGFHVAYTKAIMKQTMNDKR